MPTFRRTQDEDFRTFSRRKGEGKYLYNSRETPAWLAYKAATLFFFFFALLDSKSTLSPLHNVSLTKTFEHSRKALQHTRKCELPASPPLIANAPFTFSFSLSCQRATKTTASPASFLKQLPGGGEGGGLFRQVRRSVGHRLLFLQCRHCRGRMMTAPNYCLTPHLFAEIIATVRTAGGKGSAQKLEMRVVPSFISLFFFVVSFLFFSLWDFRVC